jgi:hypothetical protein
VYESNSTFGAPAADSTRVDGQHQDGSSAFPPDVQAHQINPTDDIDWLRMQLLDLMQSSMAVIANWKRIDHRDGCQCHRCSGTRKLMLQVQCLTREMNRRERGNVDRTA